LLGESFLENAEEFESSLRTADLLDLTSKVYKLVVEHGRDGVLQSELWKELDLTSRDGSRLAIRLEKRGMIRREKVLDGGRWTYKLTPLRLPVKLSCIEQAPCLTCPYEAKCGVNGVVTPFTCPWLADWALKEYRNGNGLDGHQFGLLTGSLRH
jgi:predicted DNA-binding transcriptional regulator